MKKLALIDGNNLLFRSYYATAAMGNLMQNSAGVYTNGIYGFVMAIQAVLKLDFTHVLVALDAKGKTIRHEAYPEYKGTRKPTPSELIMQFPLMRDYLEAAGIKYYETENYEADDIIGYFAKHFQDDFDEIVMISNDRDLMQLIGGSVTQLVSKRGFSEAIRYDRETLIAEMGIAPEQVADYKGLVGDASDNIPGVPGIGEKTAVKLLAEYGDLETILANLETLKGKLKENLEQYADQARFSKMLATIIVDFPNEFAIEEARYQGSDSQSLMSFFQKLEFHSFLKKMGTPASHAVSQPASPKVAAFTSESIESFLTSPMSLHLELFGTNYHTAAKLGFGLFDGKRKCYIPYDKALASTAFRTWLADPRAVKYVFDCKRAQAALLWDNIKFGGVAFDMLLAAYLVNPNITQEDFRVVAGTFGFQAVAYDEEIYGKGAKYALPEPDKIAALAMDKAVAIYQLREPLLKKIAEYGQERLLFDIEIPLAGILAEMETTGIAIDERKLDDIGIDLNRRIKDLDNEIRTLADEADLNINSTRQLGTVLFEKLKLPFYKKTKTGYSTDISVLQQLQGFHPIIGKIIEYRALTKLFGTYYEGLKTALGLKGDGRIHTIYKQAETQTGRLSSVEPNLQNIPIRTEEGRELRKVFVADEGCLLLSCDYSQIELRVLAEMAGVANLKAAFVAGKDVHTHTATLIFGHDTVTSEERRQAKAVNFGIIYGKTTWGLSEDLRIPPKKAEQFIASYFANYPEIKGFMDTTIANAREAGYVKTMFNRRRYIPELAANNFQTREFGKRMAMNAPIQGSAADILKIAMVRLDQAIREQGLKTRMLLQIHDEVVLLVPKTETAITRQLIIDIMQNCIETTVPLVVEAAFGDNLYEVKESA